MCCTLRPPLMGGSRVSGRYLTCTTPPSAKALPSGAWWVPRARPMPFLLESTLGSGSAGAAALPYRQTAPFAGALRPDPHDVPHQFEEPWTHIAESTSSPPPPTRDIAWSSLRRLEPFTSPWVDEIIAVVHTDDCIFDSFHAPTPYCKTDRTHVS